MTKPYKIVKQGYRITGATRFNVLATRPTRNAVGMAFTRARKTFSSMGRTGFDRMGRPLTDADELSLFGTLDPLRRGLRQWTETR